MTHVRVDEEALKGHLEDLRAGGLATDGLIERAEALVRGALPCPEGTFQARVRPWLLECFGRAIAADRAERNFRYLEESLELVQACGCTREAAHQLVDYVFNRPIGDPPQEVGGVMVTLAALCLANDMDMHHCADVELERVWGEIEAIRAKQASKPISSPLPQHVSDPTDAQQPRTMVMSTGRTADVDAMARSLDAALRRRAVYMTPATLRSVVQEMLAAGGAPVDGASSTRQSGTGRGI